MAHRLRDFRTSANGYATNFLGDRWGTRHWEQRHKAEAGTRRFPLRESAQPGASRGKCSREERLSRERDPRKQPECAMTNRRSRQPGSCPPRERSWWQASTRRLRPLLPRWQIFSRPRGGSLAAAHVENPAGTNNRIAQRFSSAGVSPVFLRPVEGAPNHRRDAGATKKHAFRNGSHSLRSFDMDSRDKYSLVDAGPVVGHEDRVAGVCWVIFHTGGLAGGKTLEAKAFLKTRDVLRGFIRNPGDGIAVSNQAAHAVCDYAGRFRFAP